MTALLARRALRCLPVAALVACGGGGDGGAEKADAESPDVTALRLVSSEPGDGATAVPVGVAISLTYSEQLKEAPALVLVGPTGKEVGGATSLGGPTVTFVPYAPLAHYNEYVLRADGGVGLSGTVPDPAAARLRIGFRTAASVHLPAIAWGAPASLSFSANEGGPPPPGQPIAVVNAGGGALDGLAVTGVQYDKGGTGWVRSAKFDATAAPATLSVEVDASGLARGDYSASLGVTAPLATNLSQTLRVSLEVR